MESIKLLISDYWVEIAPIDYVNPMFIDGTSQSSGFCRVCVKESWDSYWHIGTSMLTGYYAAFDFDTAEIGFTPLGSSSKLELTQDTSRPTRRMGISYWKISVLSIIQFSIISLIVMLILRVYFDINYFGYIDCRKCFDNGDDNSNDETEQDEVGEEEISVQELEVLINAAIKKKQAKEVSYSTNALL